MAKSWEQILGGYATATLTEEEKRQLFEAALHDQTLFDALANEEALKALLADPEVRQRIVASLQATENPQVSSSPQGWWKGWFSRPSSLAWAGGMAAMGLALIFGWQMEKDWGPMVQQELQVETSVPEAKENKDEVAFRSQLSGIGEVNEETPAPQKKNQKESEPVVPISAPTQGPQPLTIAKAINDTDRMRQTSAKVRSERVSRQEVKKERRLKAKKPIAQVLESRVVPNVPEEDQFVAPSVVFPSTAEEDFQQLSRSPPFADQVRKEDVPPSPSARDLFYANKSNRADEVGKELEGMRAQQLLGGMSSKKERVIKEEALGLVEVQEAVLDFVLEPKRGIRYSFVRKTLDSKEAPPDITQFLGNLAELRLAIESNVSGYLYVLADLGKEKWQLMRTVSLDIPVSSDGGIKVMPYQTVDFALSQVTNALGEPVVSSLTVLLSSRPLMDLGRWLGTVVITEPSEGRLVESGDQGVFIMDRKGKPEKPLRVEITLVN